MIAALYVRADGPYVGRADVDPWPMPSETALFSFMLRDARKYDGPHAVVAHPPCKRWCNLWWSDGSEAPGNDGGCFATAVAAVQRWGGVLEHPEGTRAWKAFGLTPPKFGAGWTRHADGVFHAAGYAWVCSVDQGRYGHMARKRTWLYYVGPEKPPDLDWANGATGVWVASGPGGSTAEERRAKGITLMVDTEAGKLAKELTPPAFAEALIALARGAA